MIVIKWAFRRHLGAPREKSRRGLPRFAKQDVACATGSRLRAWSRSRRAWRCWEHGASRSGLGKFVGSTGILKAIRRAPQLITMRATTDTSFMCATDDKSCTRRSSLLCPQITPHSCTSHGQEHPSCCAFMYALILQGKLSELLALPYLPWATVDVRKYLSQVRGFNCILRPQWTAVRSYAWHTPCTAWYVKRIGTRGLSDRCPRECNERTAAVEGATTRARTSPHLGAASHTRKSQLPPLNMKTRITCTF